jgi:hypothetical protein
MSFVCMYMYMELCFASAWTDQYILFLFSIKSLSFIGQCPVNMNILAPEIKVLQMGPKIQNCDFLENDSDSFN